MTKDMLIAPWQPPGHRGHDAACPVCLDAYKAWRVARSFKLPSLVVASDPWRTSPRRWWTRRPR